MDGAESFIRFRHSGRIWPSYDKCLAGAPLNSAATGPDRSKADFTFCRFSAPRGFTAEQIANELSNVSSRARERLKSDPGYIKVTAQNGYDAPCAANSGCKPSGPHLLAAEYSGSQMA
jgi:hypothetical protein